MQIKVTPPEFDLFVRVTVSVRGSSPFNGELLIPASLLDFESNVRAEDLMTWVSRQQFLYFRSNNTSAYFKAMPSAVLSGLLFNPMPQVDPTEPGG